MTKIVNFMLYVFSTLKKPMPIKKDFQQARTAS